MNTTIDAIADGIYRIHTPVEIPAGAFSFNQYLVVDDEPLLFHLGLRTLFPAVREAIARVIRPESLRWLVISHFEADECGGLAGLLATAPNAIPICSRVGAMVSITDISDRPPRALADGETLTTGKRTFTWHDAPHVPHAWDCGYLSESTTRTLFCGDLFTQPGAGDPPVTTGDVLGPSEAFRKELDYFAHAPQTTTTITKLAATEPRLLACMHGSAWQGDGGALLRELAHALDQG